jgi:hypothetical protein
MLQSKTMSLSNTRTGQMRIKDAMGMLAAWLIVLSPIIFVILAILWMSTPCGAAGLGEMSANQWRYDSTSNAYGPYGSDWTYGSVNNAYGPNGSPWSTSSATNPYAIDPPTIESGGIYGGE